MIGSRTPIDRAALALFGDYGAGARDVLSVAYGPRSAADRTEVIHVIVRRGSRVAIPDPWMDHPVVVREAS